MDPIIQDLKLCILKWNLYLSGIISEIQKYLKLVSATGIIQEFIRIGRNCKETGRFKSI